MILRLYWHMCVLEFFVLVGKCLSTAWNTNKQQRFLSFVSVHLLSFSPSNHLYWPFSLWFSYCAQEL